MDNKVLLLVVDSRAWSSTIIHGIFSVFNQVGEGASPSIDVTDGTPPAKARKGRKSKSSLVPPVPDGSISSSKPASETSSITGEGLSVRTGEGFDGDVTVGDDISVLSLDEG